MSIGVLGPLTIDGDSGAAGPRDRIVLAALVSRRGAAVTVDTLADALWGDAPPASAAKVIQGCVMRLRKALGSKAIETVPHGYRLAVPTETVDAACFERLVAKGQQLLAAGEVDRSVFVLDEALGLWRGDALVDLGGWAPGQIEATRLRELRLDAEEIRAEAQLRAGRLRQVLADARARTEAAPLRERRWWLLALAQYQDGRQAEALTTIRRARRTLVEELGLDPGPSLVSLEAAILCHDPALVAAEAPPEPSTACPYQGLVPYGVADGGTFYGREADVADCLRRLAAEGVLVVVGSSGSGKSSLVRAGVAAALQRDGDRVVVITPGANPLDSLTALPASDRPPVLVVDQCEEAVTLCRDVGEQARFFAALDDHAARAKLVVAFRADRLGELSAHPPFAAHIERGLFLLSGMDEAGLRAAIEGPALEAGLLLEPGLVDVLIRDVEGEPGALPLLSHALRQTWERREGRTLTIAGYRASGGIRGAVAQSAEQIYEQAPLDQRPIIRDLLLRLVAPTAEGDPVRNRVPRRSVATDTVHEQVIEQLVTARLVTSDEHVVELAHEALARAWPRLRGWLDDDADGQRIWRHLSTAADAWDGMSRPASELYRGVRLGRAVEWRERAHPDLNPVEREFLHASRAAAAAEERAAVDEARRQARINRRLRRLVAGVVALALVAAAGGLFAARQAQRADAQAQRADAEAEVARGRELAAAAISTIDTDPSLSKMLAVAASTTAEPTIDSLSALHRALTADRVVARHTWPEHEQAWELHADLDPGTGRLVTAAGGNRVELVDVTSGAELWSFVVADDRSEPDQFGIDAVAFVEGGDAVVIGVRWFGHPVDDDEPPADLRGVHVLDAATGETRQRWDVGRCGGGIVASASHHVVVETLRGLPAEETCRWWEEDHVALEIVDLENGRRTLVAPDADLFFGGVVSGDGRFVAYDDPSWTTIVVDGETGDVAAEIAPFDAGQTGPGVRAMNDDGSLLITGDEPLHIWDTRSAEVATVIEGHSGSSFFAAFSPSGESVYTTGRDGTLRRWSASTGQELMVVGAVGHGPVSVVEEELVVVPSFHGSDVVVLDLGPRGEVGAVDTCTGFTFAGAFAVAAEFAAVGSSCDERLGRDAQVEGEDVTQIVDLDGQELLYTVPGHASQTLAISPDGTRWVRQDEHATGPGSFVVRELASGRDEVELEGMCELVLDEPADELEGCRDYPDQPFGFWANGAIVWSPDGSMIASHNGGSIVAWDAITGALLFAQEPSAARSWVAGVIFSPDADRLIVAYDGVFETGDGGITVLSTATWEVVDHVVPEQPDADLPAFVGYSADGAELIALSGLIGLAGVAELHWYDAETLELVRVRGDLHDGSVKSVALSPDAAHIATGSSDGVVRVWDAATGQLLHDAPLAVEQRLRPAHQIQGVAFIDAVRLAVAPEFGDVLFVTTDPDELLSAARASLTRGFTPTECARFNFGDKCPTLAELRADGGGRDAQTDAGGLDMLAAPLAWSGPRVWGRDGSLR